MSASFPMLVTWIQSAIKQFSESLKPFLEKMDADTRALIADPVTTNAQLIERYLQLKVYLDGQAKAINELVKRDCLEEIQNELLKRLNRDGTNSFATDHGTAYRSVIMRASIKDREAYLDYVIENPGEFGEDMFQIAAPQITAVKAFMDANEGKLPPGVETSSHTRVNIRAS